MKKIHVALIGIVAALLTVVAPSSAQAYPDPVCTVTVSATQLTGGEPLTVTVTSDVETTLVAQLLSDRRTKQNATEFTTTFDTPRVTSARTVTVTAACGPVVRTIDVQLLPAGAVADGDADGGSLDAAGDGFAGISGILPRTGGPAFWLLLLGLLLVAAGAAAAVHRRRA